MGNAWVVFADSEGKIVDTQTGKEWPYLFWESPDEKIPISTKSGFVVQQSNVKSFFEEKLAYLGLSEQEIADFTEYWVPILTIKPWVFITFYEQNRIDQEAPLEITPAPDSIIRVYFDHLLLDAPIKTTPQTLTPGVRKGFTVTEWGGRR
jgi:hypothetical protein